MAFHDNPLSLSVPDEHLHNWARVTSSTPPVAAPTAAVRRSRSGRSLSELTVDDLLKTRRPWREFMGGLRPAREFSVPRSLEEASFKLSENVFEFIGNYLMVALVCVCSVLYKRPVALVGILVVSAAWEWLQKHQAGGAGGGTAVAPGAVGPPGRRGRRGGAPNGAAPAVLPPKSKLHQLKQLAVTIFTWAVLMFSQVVPALGLAALATIAAVCLHGVLRNPVPPIRGRRILR